MDPRKLGSELALSGESFVNGVSKDVQVASKFFGDTATPVIRVSSTAAKIVIGTGVELGKALLSATVDPTLKYLATVFTAPAPTTSPVVWHDIGNHR